jgi:voltage-gated potassium channel
LKKKSWVKTTAIYGTALAVYLGLVLLLVWLERGKPNANIKGVGDGLWYSIVTMTTVGYGDMFPSTRPGKLVGVVFLLSSVGILGLLVGRISAFLGAMSEARRLGYNGTSFTDHVVIVGWNRFSQTVAEQVLAAGKRVAILADRKDQIELIAETFDRHQVYALFADYGNPSLLQKANVERASIVFVNLADDTDKLVYLINGRKVVGEGVPFGVIVNDPELVFTFRRAGADVALCKDEIASKLIASFIFEPEVARYTEDLIATAKSDEDFDVQQYDVIAANPYVGRRYLDAYFDIKRRHDAILIGLVSTRTGEPVLLRNPDDPELVILEGDRLILITSGAAARRLESAFGVGEGGR